MFQVFGCVTGCDAFVTHTVIVHHHIMSSAARDMTTLKYRLGVLVAVFWVKISPAISEVQT